METAVYFIGRDDNITYVTTWLKNTTNALFDNTFFTLLLNAWIAICDH